MTLQEAMKESSCAAGTVRGSKVPFYAAVRDAYGRVRVFCPFAEVVPENIDDDVVWVRR